MLDYIKGAWARLEVRWHAVAAAFVAAVPVLLDQLHVINLRPILEHLMSPDMAGVVEGLMPFALLFCEKLFAITPHPDDLGEPG